ncbi:hypothetical protein B566_EDAN008161 [Ephemera danica]|nr:hypothetical protein B566_EDAN008161 [Ephemera danica]
MYTMENFWNQKYLRPPAVYTIKFQDSLNIGELKSICSELFSTLQKNEALQTEAALLSRMIYKNRNKFRFDKGFQNMRKVHRCLRRYLQLDFCSALQNFMDCLPSNFKDMYLPSRQMLEYILVRLMGLASLLHQSCTFCETGAYLLHQERIHLGHSWNIPAVFLAIAARIWSLCELWQKSVIWSYQKLLEFLSKLPSTKSLWLPQDCLLPPDLFSWLGKERKVKKKQDMKIFEIFVEDDDDVCDEVELVDNVDPQVEMDDVDTRNSVEANNSVIVENLPKSNLTPVPETRPAVDMVPTLQLKSVEEDLGDKVIQFM